jgi:hypothetical protein
MSQGDDCGEDRMDAQRYIDLGFRVTDIIPPDGKTFSFCSHRFVDGHAIPENVLKPFYVLMCNPFDYSYLAQFKMLFRKHPNVDYYTDLWLYANTVTGQELTILH